MSMTLLSVCQRSLKWLPFKGHDMTSSLKIVKKERKHLNMKVVIKMPLLCYVPQKLLWCHVMKCYHCFSQNTLFEHIALSADACCCRKLSEGKSYHVHS
jgi:hypothetical protein